MVSSVDIMVVVGEEHHEVAAADDDGGGSGAGDYTNRINGGGDDNDDDDDADNDEFSFSPIDVVLHQTGETNMLRASKLDRNVVYTCINGLWSLVRNFLFFPRIINNHSSRKTCKTNSQNISSC